MFWKKIKNFDSINTYFLKTFISFFKFTNLIGFNEYRNLNFDLNSNLDPNS